MKIKVKQIIENGEVISNKIISVEKCCDKMMEENNFKFRKEYSCDTEETRFKICYPIRIIEISYEDAFDDTYYYGMDYCPFCCEKIEIEVAESEDATKIIERLHNDLMSLRKEIHRADSKSECKMLEQKIHDISSKLDGYYKTDDFRNLCAN